MSRVKTAATTIGGAALGLAAACLASHPAFADAAANCRALNGTVLTLNGVATTQSLTATDVPAGALTPLLGEFCYINATVSSDADPAQSQIAISVALPAAGWNGRFLGTGNGGFAGSVSTNTLLLGLLGNYAVANTDMGTGLLYKCDSIYCGSKEGQAAAGVPVGGLYGHAASLRDFGYAATHLMTLAGKQLTAAFYGSAPTYSYFHGCSTGGQQALMEAQRFPDDYDGILAGSPAYDRTHLHIGAAALYEATHFAPDAYLTNAALALAHQGVLSQCAGKDGGLATDDYLTRPSICKFDATTLQCTGQSGEVPCTDQSASSCSCLVPDQAVAMNRVWSGAQDNVHRRLYPGYERGAEEPVALTAQNGYTGNLGLVWQQSGTEPQFDSLDYWAYGPNFQWQSLFSNTTSLQGELATRISRLDLTPVGSSNFEQVLNANNTDLSAFTKHGGKLLMYAGYEDPLIPSASTLDYYNAVKVGDPANVASYLRLFMAPGMWHCSGGPGVNAFGNLSSNFPPKPGDPSDDVMAAMVAWREGGTAPSTILATRYVNDDQTQGIAFQRPLCTYPMVAKYTSGDTTQAASYACVAKPIVTNQQFNKLYGPY